MNALLGLYSGEHVVAFVLGVLVQSSLVAAAALIAGRSLTHNPAILRWVVLSALVCLGLSPFVGYVVAQTGLSTFAIRSPFENRNDGRAATGDESDAKVATAAAVKDEAVHAPPVVVAKPAQHRDEDVPRGAQSGTKARIPAPAKNYARRADPLVDHGGDRSVGLGVVCPLSENYPELVATAVHQAERVADGCGFNSRRAPWRAAYAWYRRPAEDSHLTGRGLSRVGRHFSAACYISTASGRKDQPKPVTRRAGSRDRTRSSAGSRRGADSTHRRRRVLAASFGLLG